ncbi:hypothetical protein VNO80_30039 [Phaseolus coccineus]|uniref:Uncharacterized protein n=1 Tax=Phaseolus coccineus TaxID=3886 RepID=A0AAN9QFG6_PHACN
MNMPYFLLTHFYAVKQHVWYCFLSRFSFLIYHLLDFLCFVSRTRILSTVEISRLICDEQVAWRKGFRTIFLTWKENVGGNAGLFMEAFDTSLSTLEKHGLAASQGCNASQEVGCSMNEEAESQLFDNFTPANSLYRMSALFLDVKMEVVAIHYLSLDRKKNYDHSSLLNALLIKKQQRDSKEASSIVRKRTCKSFFQDIIMQVLPLTVAVFNNQAYQREIDGWWLEKLAR